MQQRTRGFSLVGLLITMVCIVVLFVIGMNALNRAVTGEGSAVRGTVRSTQDMIMLQGLYTSLMVAGNDLRDSRLPTPHLLAQSNDISLNTTANFYSSLIAQNYIAADGLIAANEYSPFVEQMIGYDYHAYQPAIGVYWDPAFEADLDYRSNTSFAHMPLFGDRYRRGWEANFNRDAVLVGNRGPQDGIDDPNSYTYGRSGVWGGHAVYGDGRIEFLESFTPPGLTIQGDGSQQPDNIFAMEQGPNGSDAILSFTKEMTRSGPVLQHD